MIEVSPKTCAACGNVFPATAEFFDRQKGAKDGLRSECKTCRHAGPTTCAACGISFTHHGFGKYQDFHSIECRNMGRAYCKQCGEPLTQDETFKKDFCKDLCQQRFYRGRGTISSYLLEEHARTTCKCGCGMPITQLKKGSPKLFYDKSHAKRYWTVQKHGLDLSHRWGRYLPETRKALVAIEEYLQSPSVAFQVANAIDREYVPRNRLYIIPKLIICHCKCGKEFHRLARGGKSREHCDECLKVGVGRGGENNPAAKLTWGKVDEIKHLHSTKHLTHQELANMYGVSRSTIRNILNNKIWKPENDPRRKAQAQSSMASD